MEPVIMALKQHYGDSVAIIVADVANPETSLFLDYFNVPYVPAFFFINSEGEVVGAEAGMFDFTDFTARIDPLLEDEFEERELSRMEYFFAETITDAVAQRGFVTLLLVFIGGVVTSISPCILSMVPLLISYIGAYGEGPRSRGFMLSLFFVTGLAITFAIFGFIAAYFGQIFGQISVFWYYILVAVTILMGLQLLGVFNFNLPGLKKIPVLKVGFGSALIMGMLFGLVASPCATPVLAVIITYAAAQAEPLYGSSLLFVYGLGHGLPLLAAGTFTGLARNLPKLSRYTQYLSYASGLILIILGLVLLVWILW